MVDKNNWEDDSFKGRFSLSLKEAAVATCRSKKTLTRFNKRGLLAFNRAARTITIRVDELQRFLKDTEGN